MNDIFGILEKPKKGILTVEDQEIPVYLTQTVKLKWKTGELTTLQSAEFHKNEVPPRQKFFDIKKLPLLCYLSNNNENMCFIAKDIYETINHAPKR